MINPVRLTIMFFLAGFATTSAHEQENMQQCPAIQDDFSNGFNIQKPPVGGPPHAILVRICGIEYAIPSNYFDVLPSHELDESGVLLHVLASDFSPETAGNYRLFCCEINKTIRIVTNTYPSAWEGFIGHYKNEGGLSATYEKEEDIGLQAVNAKSPFPFLYHNDLYVLGNIHEPELYIDCDREKDESIKFPQCSEHFLFQNMYIDISFSRTELSRWRDFRDFSTKLMSEFQSASKEYRRDSAR